MHKIVVIGWTSWFGKWLCEFIVQNFDKKDFSLVMTWRDEVKWAEISKNLWCGFSTDNISCVKDADIVIVSVPINITEKVIKEVAPHLKHWAVIWDVTSVKQIPAKTMYENVPDWVIVIPAHPVFWPFVKKIIWQVIVLTTDEKTKKTAEYIFLKKFLGKVWAKLIETTALEHDRFMSVIQWLTHYCLFVTAETMRRMKVDIAFSQNFVSPVYKMMISLISRYMNQNPRLYADIQIHNNQNIDMHDVFINVAKDFSGFVKDADVESFVWTLENTSKFFGPQADKWQKYTDRLIYLCAKQLEKLNKNIWKQLSFENIYTKQILKWVVKSYDDENIYLEDWQKFIYDEWIILD